MFRPREPEGNHTVTVEANAGAGEPPKTLEDVQAELARTQKELETAREKAQKFSGEAAAARIARKEEYESKIATLEAKLAEVEKRTPTADNSTEAAQLRAKIADLEKRDQEREKREAEREAKTLESTQRAIVTELVAHHKIENPEDAVELLMRRTKLAKDGTLTRSAKDKDTGALVDIAVTRDNFEESGLLGKTFWPAKGVPGGGGGQPSPIGGPGGDVLTRSLGSQKEFNKNYPEILANMRKAGGR